MSLISFVRLYILINASIKSCLLLPSKGIKLRQNDKKSSLVGVIFFTKWNDFILIEVSFPVIHYTTLSVLESCSGQCSSGIFRSHLLHERHIQSTANTRTSLKSQIHLPGAQRGEGQRLGGHAKLLFLIIPRPTRIHREMESQWMRIGRFHALLIQACLKLIASRGG